MQNFNWIRESVTSTGTGAAVTLAGAPAGFVPFSTRFANGTIVSYEIADGNNRESGIATLTNATTLTKITIWEKLESGTLSALPATGLNLSGNAVASLSASAETTEAPGVAQINLHATNKYVVDAFMPATLTTASMPLTNTYFCPLYVTGPCVISGMGLNVTVLGSLSTIRLGLYRQDGAYLRQLRTTADMDVSTETGSTGFKTASFSGGNIALRPGMYYAVVSGSGAAITCDMVSGRHPFIPARTKYMPSHLISGSGAIPLSANYGPVDHNWAASDNPSNHAHIVGIIP